MALDSGLSALDFVEGGIVRGPQDRKELAFLFTGGDYGEGTELILDTLKARNTQAAFFLTGDYLKQAAHAPLLERAVAEGHYLGPHSHGHLLYAPWEDRSKSLVTEEQFKADLKQNLDVLGKYTSPAVGLSEAADNRDHKSQPQPTFFVPPYEWYNSQHAKWAQDLGCQVINFTPGTRSNRDYVPEGDKAFKTSQEILSDILAYETNDPQGLNGHLLLLHLGSQRQDKFHARLGDLIDQLTNRGYTIVRVDQLLAE